MPHSKNLVTLGRFGSVFGVKGWIKVHSFTEPLGNILQFHTHWLIQNNKQAWQPINIEAYKIQGQSIIAKMKGIDERETARQFTNKEIAIHREHLPKLETEQFYLHDLIGMKVYNQNNLLLGHITDFQEAGSHHIFIIKGEKEHWLPYTDDVIKKINLDEQYIEVDWDPEF